MVQAHLQTQSCRIQAADKVPLHLSHKCALWPVDKGMQAGQA